jgi:hypothetical protein
MDGSYLYSPFYPQAGSGGGASPVFRILSFVNNSPLNERGVPLESITFNWSYANGVPISQAISPLVGTIPNSQRTVTLTSQDIADTITFALDASALNEVGNTVSRTASTQLLFVNPIFHGVVSNNSPTEADILSMEKRIALFNAFRTTVNAADEHSCFASPMSNPIVDIRETTFGLSVLETYNIMDNFMITMIDELVVPYRVLVKAIPEHTVGRNMPLDIIF